MNILQRLFDNNEREVDKYRRKVEQINALEPAMKALTDQELLALLSEGDHTAFEAFYNLRCPKFINLGSLCL